MHSKGFLTVKSNKIEKIQYGGEYEPTISFLKWPSIPCGYRGLAQRGMNPGYLGKKGYNLLYGRTGISKSVSVPLANAAIIKWKRAYCKDKWQKLNAVRRKKMPVGTTQTGHLFRRRILCRRLYDRVPKVHKRIQDFPLDINQLRLSPECSTFPKHSLRSIGVRGVKRGVQ